MLLQRLQTIKGWTIDGSKTQGAHSLRIDFFLIAPYALLHAALHLFYSSVFLQCRINTAAPTYAQSPIGQRPNRPHGAGASHQSLGSCAVL